MITHVSDVELQLQQALADARHEALAWSVTAENLEAAVQRLQGEAGVMTGLLAQAVVVLQTVEPECATESEGLTCLRTDI